MVASATRQQRTKEHAGLTAADRPGPGCSRACDSRLRRREFRGGKMGAMIGREIRVGGCGGCHSAACEQLSSAASGRA